MIMSPPFEELDLPNAPLELKTEGNTWWVKDLVRNAWFVLSPEEWVRQHVVHFLLNHLNFPKNLLSIEKQVGKSSKRTDLVGYGKEGLPILLVECKAPTEKPSREVLRQALQYNSQVAARWVWITNGNEHWVFSKSENTQEYKQEKQLPIFEFMH